MVIPGSSDFPNPNWIEEIEDLLFTSAIITLEQAEATTVLVVSCTLDPRTTDGSVRRRDVTGSILSWPKMHIRSRISRSGSIVLLGYCQKAQNSYRFRRRRQFHGRIAATMLLLGR